MIVGKDRNMLYLHTFFSACIFLCVVEGGGGGRKGESDPIVEMVSHS